MLIYVNESIVNHKEDLDVADTLAPCFITSCQWLSRSAKPRHYESRALQVCVILIYWMRLLEGVMLSRQIGSSAKKTKGG